MGINEIELGLIAFDLAAEKEVDVEFVVIPFQRVTVEVADTAHLLAENAGGIIHRRRLGEPLAAVEIAPQQSDDRLRQRQAAAGQNGEGAFTGLNKGVHLAAGVDLVITRVGARIGGHDQAVFGDDAEAIGHAGCPWSLVTGHLSRNGLKQSFDE